MTAEEALAMGELTIKAERACEACDGTGRFPSVLVDEREEDEPPCPDCHGSGRTEVELTVGEIARWTLEMVPVAVIDRGELEDVIDTVKRRMLEAASKIEGLRSGPIESAEWLRVVQEGAHTLRELTALLVERRPS